MGTKKSHFAGQIQFLASLRVKHFGSVTHTLFGEVPESILDVRLRTVPEKQRPLGLRWLTELSQRHLIALSVGPWTTLRKISVGHLKVHLAQFSVFLKSCTRRWLRCSTKGSGVRHGKWPKAGMFSAFWNQTSLPCVSVSRSPSFPCVLSKFWPLGHYQGVLQSARRYEQHPICLHSSGFLKSPTENKRSQQLLM